MTRDDSYLYTIGLIKAISIAASPATGGKF
jgi:hypothetical protein